MITVGVDLGAGTTKAVVLESPDLLRARYFVRTGTKLEEAAASVREGVLREDAVYVDRGDRTDGGNGHVRGSLSLAMGRRGGRVNPALRHPAVVLRQELSFQRLSHDGPPDRGCTAPQFVQC